MFYSEIILLNFLTYRSDWTFQKFPEGRDSSKKINKILLDFFLTRIVRLFHGVCLFLTIENHIGTLSLIRLKAQIEAAGIEVEGLFIPVFVV